MQSDRAVLLINLGSPRSPDVGDVRRYLNEFLMDPYVLRMPWPVRRAFVSLVILPFRPQRSAAAYRHIWGPDGSPLIKHTADLRDALSRHASIPVAMAMRYGSPSIADALAELLRQGAKHLTVVALYPQHADSTCTTTREAVLREVKGMPNLELHWLGPFFEHAAFIDALAQRAEPYIRQDAHVLFSYHGLPEQHLKQADPSGRHCLRQSDCCSTPSPAHATCYRYQCLRTTTALATRLRLAEGSYSSTFQSRLGPARWLSPYTDLRLQELAREGKKRVTVICPSFVADNLETLEEIAIRGRELFMTAGGEHFDVVPCLNADPKWVTGLAAMIDGSA